jgi:hypothetical protein
MCVCVSHPSGSFFFRSMIVARHAPLKIIEIRQKESNNSSHSSVSLSHLISHSRLLISLLQHLSHTHGQSTGLALNSPNADRRSPSSRPLQTCAWFTPSSLGGRGIGRPDQQLKKQLLRGPNRPKGQKTITKHKYRDADLLTRQCQNSGFRQPRRCFTKQRRHDAQNA